jgi:hypothetical protein
LNTANGKLKAAKFVSIYCYESPFPEIPPDLPFSKGGELWEKNR